MTMMIRVTQRVRVRVKVMDKKSIHPQNTEIDTITGTGIVDTVDTNMRKEIDTNIIRITEKRMKCIIEIITGKGTDKIMDIINIIITSNNLTMNNKMDIFGIIIIGINPDFHTKTIITIGNMTFIQNHLFVKKIIKIRNGSMAE